MDVHRIVIEKKVLESFKRRAFKEFPNEHIEALLGRLQITNDMNVLSIYAFEKLDKEKAEKRIVVYSMAEEEIEAGTSLKYFGTLHTHPKSRLEPSDEDWKSFLHTSQVEEQLVNGYYSQVLLDEVMGIMYIDRKAKQKFSGIAFYNRQGNQIEVVISEHEKK